MIWSRENIVWFAKSRKKNPAGDPYVWRITYESGQFTNASSDPEILAMCMRNMSLEVVKMACEIHDNSLAEKPGPVLSAWFQKSSKKAGE